MVAGEAEQACGEVSEGGLNLLKLDNSAQRGKHVMLGATQPMIVPDGEDLNE
jgi:hypothetical protein